MEVTQAPSGPNWSTLLEELLGLILARLNLMDHFRFSSVCKQWRSVAAATSAMNKSIFLVNTDDPQRLIRHVLSRSWTSWQGARIVGGFEGWLILEKVNEIILLNPASGEAPIRLPHLCHFPLLPPLYPFPVVLRASVEKVILSSEPRSSTRQCTIVFGDCIGRLFFCVLGDTAWTMFYQGPIWDIAFYRDQLYAINDKGMVEVFDSGLYLNPTVRVNLPVHHGYLVNASDRLFVIGMQYNRRQFRRNGYHVSWSKYRLTHMKVYELDQVHSVYVEVESLGDNILFFNPIFSLYRSAQDHRDLRPNHLYFMKSETGRGYTSAGYNTAGGYSLDDKALVTCGGTGKGSLVFFGLLPLFYGTVKHCLDTD